MEEVEYALKTLKPNRSGGPDQLSPEHLKYSGAVFRNWLCHVFNWNIHLEQIPPCFKQVIVIPCFKGKGRNPLLRKNYCGITLTSVISKTLEIIILDQLALTFEKAGFPSLTQMAYRKQVSSYDSVFAGQGQCIVNVLKASQPLWLAKCPCCRQTISPFNMVCGGQIKAGGIPNNDLWGNVTWKALQATTLRRKKATYHTVLHHRIGVWTMGFLHQ